MNDIITLQKQIEKLKSTSSQKGHIVSALVDTKQRFPVVEYEVRAYFIRRGLRYHTVNFNDMNYTDIVFRKKWYVDILQDEIERIQSNSIPWTKNAINILYNNPPQFNDDYVLHEKDSRQLKVSDLLSVIGYTTKTIEAMGGKIDEKFGITMQVLSCVDLALNNKPQDKPFNKCLHIANDVLTEIAKKAKEDEISDSQLSGISLLFDLAIDFFVKE